MEMYDNKGVMVKALFICKEAFTAWGVCSASMQEGPAW